MPALPKRPCAYPGGCTELVESGCCAKHQRAADRARGTTAERGYAKGWPRVRSAKLAADPFCQIRTHCQGAMATEVDHIVPISERPDLRLEWSNLQSSCKACNVAKRNRRAREFAAVPGGSVSVARPAMRAEAL